MSTPGYPDYARLSQSGGKLLYGNYGTVPVNTVLFKGYVGDCPYVNFFCSTQNTGDFCKILFQWYTDDTFTTQVAYKYAIRGAANLGTTQYANLTPWLLVFYVSVSGNNFPFYAFSVYGAQGPAGANQLNSLDVPVGFYSATIPATTAETQTFSHVQPGAALLSGQFFGGNWLVALQYYDYGSATWLDISYLDNTGYGDGFNVSVGLLDTPMRLYLNNRNAAAEFAQVAIVGTQ